MLLYIYICFICIKHTHILYISIQIEEGAQESKAFRAHESYNTTLNMDQKCQWNWTQLPGSTSPHRHLPSRRHSRLFMSLAPFSVHALLTSPPKYLSKLSLLLATHTAILVQVPGTSLLDSQQEPPAHLQVSGPFYRQPGALSKDQTWSRQVVSLIPNLPRFSAA